MSVHFKRAALFSVILSMVAVGCGDEKSKKGVDSDGNCNNAYVSAFNAVGQSAQEVMRYYNTDGSPTASGSANPSAVRNALRSMDQDCDAFITNYSGVSCRAELRSSGSVGMTDVAGLERACAEVKAVLNGGSAKTTTPTESTDDAVVMQNFFIENTAPIQTDENVEFISEEQ